MKFLSHFFKTHRIRWTAFSEICPARDDAPVFQRDLEDGGHLVVARLFSIRVSIEAHPPNHILHVGTVHHRIRELRLVRLAVHQQDRHAELHAEFCLQSGRRTMMYQRIEHVVIGADFHLRDIGCTDRVLPDQALEFGHPRMSQRSGRKRLD